MVQVGLSASDNVRGKYNTTASKKRVMLTLVWLSISHKYVLV